MRSASADMVPVPTLEVEADDEEDAAEAVEGEGEVADILAGLALGEKKDEKPCSTSWTKTNYRKYLFVPLSMQTGSGMSMSHPAAEYYNEENNSCLIKSR